MIGEVGSNSSVRMQSVYSTVPAKWVDVWVSHTFCEKNKEDYISIATDFLSWQKNGPFLKSIINVIKKSMGLLWQYSMQKSVNR